MERPIVIIGSGFSGLAAAFHCAEAGHKVVVIEKKEELGGYFRELKRQFPTNSCGVCFMHPSYPSYCPHIESLLHPNIETMVSTEVKRIKKSEEGILLTIKNKEGERELYASSLILATGFELFDIAKKPEYGGGIYENVISAIEMERKIYESLATRELPSFGKVAYIQCVGSRDLKVGASYCSSFCCMFALKQAMFLKELANNIDITIFYMDMRAFGKGYELYYREALEKGIKFVRSAVAAIRKRETTGKLELLYTSLGKPAEDTFDTVVLSQGVSYSKEFYSLLSELSGIPDFCSPEPFKGRELLEDVYITGSAFEPMDIPDSVIDGIYVAAKILEKRGIKVSSEVPPVTKTTKMKNIKVVAFNLSLEASSKLSEKYPHLLFVKSVEEIKFYVENERPDGVVIIAEDIRQMEGVLKYNNYFGFHINSFYLVSANSFNLEEEIDTAIYRLKNVKKLPYMEKEINQRVLVLGGGLAGLVAARKFARLGFDVVLVEKSSVLGGRALKIADKRLVVESIIEDIKRENKVEILMEFELKKLSGRFGNFSCVVESKDEKREIKVGAVLLATGGTERRKGVFPIEDNEKVFTAFDFDEKKEELLMARKVVMLQCVGSRTDENPYCYRVCCIKAVDNAIQLKRERPEIEVYIIHKDVRTYGYGENLYRQARALGVQFIRMASEPEVTCNGGKVNIKVEEEGTELVYTIDADFLILSTGINPNTERLTFIPKDGGGFIKPYNSKSGILDISNGIFAAGLCLAPQHSNDVIKQAEAAAIRGALKLSKQKIMTRFDTAFVIDKYCCGCELCVKACPVSARYIDEEKKVARVDETLCEGCGTCAMVCPNKASQHKLFEHKSMLKIIDSIID